MKRKFELTTLRHGGTCAKAASDAAAIASSALRPGRNSFDVRLRLGGLF